MCVIAFSEKGKDIPTEEQIRKMWRANPDGAGYAYVNNRGKVIYRKGFMTVDDLLKDLSEPEKFKNTNFAIHFRIGTSGKNDERTCHPFPVSNNFGDLVKTTGEEDAVLFHNGVIGEGGLVNKLSSDTQDFVVAFAPMLAKFNQSKARDKYIAEFTKGNRLLVMYKNNKFKMFGDWKKDGDLYVSNETYKSYGFGSYSYYGYDYDDYDYWWKDQDRWQKWYDERIKQSEQEEEKETEKVDLPKLFEEIIINEYKLVSDTELSEMLGACEAFTDNEMYIGKYIFGYDDNTNIVWLEEEPQKLAK